MSQPPGLPALPDKNALLEEVKWRRDKWDRDFRPDNVEPVGPGEESVWDYPRPPSVVPTQDHLRVMYGDRMVAETTRALAMKETAGAPVPYFRPDDVQTDWLMSNGKVGICEWKGASVGYDLVLPSGDRVADAAWTYPDPFEDLGQGYIDTAGWFAFYPARIACFVGEERVRPQPGNVYGGWVTDRIKGPVKGAPGTEGW